MLGKIFNFLENYISENRFVRDLGCVQLIISSVALIALALSFFIANQYHAPDFAAVFRGFLTGAVLFFVGSEIREITAENKSLSDYVDMLLESREKVVSNSYKSNISKNSLQQIQDMLKDKKGLTEREAQVLNLTNYTLDVIKDKV